MLQFFLDPDTIAFRRALQSEGARRPALAEAYVTLGPRAGSRELAAALQSARNNGWIGGPDSETAARHVADSVGFFLRAVAPPAG